MYLEILKTAFFRSLWQGFVGAALQFFTSLQLGLDQNAALVAAGVSFFGYLAMRGAAEGVYDGDRQRRGEVHNSDVGSNTTTVTTTTPIAAGPVVITQPDISAAPLAPGS